MIFVMILAALLVIVPVIDNTGHALWYTIPISLISVIATYHKERSDREKSHMGLLGVELRGLVYSYGELTSNSKSNSVWSILNDLLNNTDFQSQLIAQGNAQVATVLIDNCKILSDAYGYLFKVSDRMMHEYASADDIHEAFIRIYSEWHNYRKLIDEFMLFYNSTRNPVLNDAQFEVIEDRIYNGLANHYNMFMNDLRQLGNKALVTFAVQRYPGELMTPFPYKRR